MVQKLEYPSLHQLLQRTKGQPLTIIGAGDLGAWSDYVSDLQSCLNLLSMEGLSDETGKHLESMVIGSGLNNELAMEDGSLQLINEYSMEKERDPNRIFLLFNYKNSTLLPRLIKNLSPKPYVHLVGFRFDSFATVVQQGKVSTPQEYETLVAFQESFLEMTKDLDSYEEIILGPVPDIQKLWMSASLNQITSTTAAILDAVGQSDLNQLIQPYLQATGMMDSKERYLRNWENQDDFDLHVKTWGGLEKALVLAWSEWGKLQPVILDYLAFTEKNRNNGKLIEASIQAARNAKNTAIQASQRTSDGQSHELVNQWACALEHAQKTIDAANAFALETATELKKREREVGCSMVDQITASNTTNVLSTSHQAIQDAATNAFHSCTAVQKLVQKEKAILSDLTQRWKLFQR